jgi:hypothetical protein
VVEKPIKLLNFSHLSAFTAMESTIGGVRSLSASRQEFWFVQRIGNGNRERHG